MSDINYSKKSQFKFLEPFQQEEKRLLKRTYISEVEEKVKI